MGSGIVPAACKLCDLEQVTRPLQAEWEVQSPYPGGRNTYFSGLVVGLN